ncbi:MAG: YkvA family protein [Clostridia bacterium]
MNLKENAKKLKENISTIYIAMKKKETPLYAKILAGITVGYALSPIDFVPDFIPVLGYLDDIIILPIFAWLSIKMIPKEIIEISKEEAKDLWKDGKPKKWYYAIPIVLVWCLIIYVIIKNIIYKI